MSQKTASHTQHAPAPGAPFAAAWAEPMARLSALAEEMDRMEKVNLERANEAVEEMARLTKETLAYGARLGAEWRRLAMQSAMKSAAAVTGAGS